MPTQVVLYIHAFVYLFPASPTEHSLAKRQTSNGAGDKRVVCYFANWSVYRQGTAKFVPQNINPYLCTHLIYAFGGLGKDDTIQPFDKYQDLEKGESIELKARNDCDLGGKLQWASLKAGCSWEFIRTIFNNRFGCLQG